MAKNFHDIVIQYNNRFPDFGIDISNFEFDKNLRTIIVIPCFKEPDILQTLQSLYDCNTPKYPTLVLIFVNASEDALDEVKIFNKTTFETIKYFIEQNPKENLQFEVFLDNELTAKHAGVGTARKTLMDTALKIFDKNETDGIIVNTDSDCFFTPNYINSIENAFEDESLELAVMHYEHRIETEKDKVLAKGITEYELHLRYYKQALEWTEYPNVLETIGSCMVCLASVYALEGGMNKRKAGEDFYFINKLAKSRKATTIIEATVLPSCRTSDRVPFGTGKAMNDYVDKETKMFQSYDIECFISLKQFLEQIEVLYEKGFEALELDATGKAFLIKIEIQKNLEEIKKQSNNFERFKSRFFYWFDHLKALQFIHYYTEHLFPKVNIDQAAIEFLRFKSDSSNFENSFEILTRYRENEKKLQL